MSPFINAQQYISVQTLKEKYVTLYIVQGIEEDQVKTKLKRIDEVQELKWIDVNEFMQEALKFGMQNPNLSVLQQNFNQSKEKAVW